MELGKHLAQKRKRALSPSCWPFLGIRHPFLQGWFPGISKRGGSHARYFKILNILQSNCCCSLTTFEWVSWEILFHGYISDFIIDINREMGFVFTGIHFIAKFTSVHFIKWEMNLCMLISTLSACAYLSGAFLQHPTWTNSLRGECG